MPHQYVIYRSRKHGSGTSDDAISPRIGDFKIDNWSAVLSTMATERDMLCYAFSSSIVLNRATAHRDNTEVSPRFDTASDLRDWMAMNSQMGGRLTTPRMRAWLNRGKKLGPPNMEPGRLITTSGTITDNFNRANESPIGAPWSAVGTRPTVDIDTNEAKATGGGKAVAKYDGVSWNLDHSAQARRSVFAANYFGVIVNAHDVPEEYYDWSHDGEGPNAFTRIRRFQSGSFTNLAQIVSIVDLNDVIKFSRVGDDLIGENLTKVESLTLTNETSVQSGGFPGIFLEVASRGDDWEGTGEVIPVTVIPIGHPDPTSRWKYKRLEVIFDASAQTTGQPAAQVDIDNLDSNSNIASQPTSNLKTIFEALGFDTRFTYIPPAG